MKLIFYFQVWCQLIHLLKSARGKRIFFSFTNILTHLVRFLGNCRNGHVESFYLREEFCKNDDEKYLYDFLTSADIMIKSDCSLIDTCSRITDVNLDDYQVADFIVVGGGVAGKSTFHVILISDFEFFFENRFTIFAVLIVYLLFFI